MKKTILLIALATLVPTSCKQDPKENQKNAETQTETKVVTEEHSLNNDWVNEIILNDGIKWQANKETTDGVKAMLSLINASTATSKDDHKKLGDALNDVKNTVVKECTMKGASHDNLHVWLHPLIEKIELLQNIESNEKGSKITSNIQENLEKYHDYFD